MAKNSPERHITASTIDQQGAQFAKTRICKEGCANQIDVKIEDVTADLPYPNEHFDFIYARLVLHYLPRNELTKSLHKLNRILKKEGRLFVVVRSENCFQAKDENSTLDLETGMTTYISENGRSYSRFFHNTESIQSSLLCSGFHIKHTKTYQEQLCIDFQRTQPSKHIDHLIEVFSSKIARNPIH